MLSVNLSRLSPQVSFLTSLNHPLKLIFLVGKQAAAILAPILVLLLLGATVLICVLKKKRAKANADNRISTDENPTYGDYYDPNPTSEVEDRNSYYSSDYEVGAQGSRTTDNNWLYEDE